MLAEPPPFDSPPSASERRAAWIALLLLGLLAAFIVVRLGPPDVVLRDAPPGVVSAERARTHLERIAAVPHPSGSAAARDVEAYLRSVLESLGLGVELYAGPACTEAAGLRRCGHVRNVIGTLPGRVHDGAILLSAHYDSVSNAPGAGDDGAAVAALLETARALVHAGPLERDVIFAFVDGEEDLLLGSTQLCPAAGLRSRVGLVANFDARGSGGAVTLISASSGSAAVLAELASILPHPVLSSFYPSVARVLPNATDAEVYERCGLQTLSFAFAEGFEHYHQGTDTADHLDDRSMQHHASHALALAQRFSRAGAPAAGERDAGLVFFDIGGLAVVRYSHFAALSIALVLAMLTGVALWRLVRTARVSLGALIPSALVVAAGSLAAAMIGAFVVRVVTLGWPPWSAYLHAPALAGCAACFVVAACLALAPFARRWPVPVLSHGALVFWLVLALLTAVLLPGASQLFMWPAAALLASTALGLRTGPSGVAAHALLLVPAVVMMTPVIYTVLVVIGAPGVAGAMICVALVLGAGLELVRRLGVRARAASIALAALGTLLAVGLAVQVRLEPAPPLPNTIAYAVDSETGRALWVSPDASEDAYKRQFLGAHPARERVPAFGSDRSLLVNAAPLVALEPPVLELVSDAWLGDERTLVLRVRSPRTARSVLVLENTGALFSRFSFDGAAPLPIVRFSPELDQKLLRLLTGLGDEARWSITLFSPRAEGSRLELTTQHPGTLEFQATDRSEGVAVLPASFVPRSTAWTEGYPGDHTLVSGPRLRVGALLRPTSPARAGVDAVQ